MGKMGLFSWLLSFLRNGTRESTGASGSATSANSPQGASPQTLGAAPSAAARCVFVAFLFGSFPQVFIPFILRWS